MIGGGITGAGVALDAASRGYSVALLERGDYAQGTSSRSSKMVHGGLRYLQNFDLGLVREALLERQLMVQLAPHLVYPTPFLVPSLGEERRDRSLGARAQHVRRDGDRRGSAAAAARCAPPRTRTRTSTGRPTATARSTARRLLELVPALAPRDPNDAYLFYDCQTDDVRLTLTILGEAERFGAVMLNGAEVTEVARPTGGRAAGVAFAEAESGEPIEVHADNVVNATGVWADRIRPEEILDEEDVPRISPEPRHPRDGRPRGPRRSASAACIVPAGEGRTIFALPWYGRTLIGTTDNDYDGDIDARPAGRRRRRLPARRGQRVLRHRPRRRRPHRRLRRRAAADLDRRPEEVGRHLAQGRAVRDLLGDADDHRRQADHLAADGEADRRPPGRARGPRGALPHRRDPARDGGRPRGPRGAGRCGGGARDQLAFRYGHAARARARPRRRATASWPRRSSRAAPTCSPRS